MNTITLRNIGPIRHATINFGDLTVFVGPQASGKSIALQFLKLLIDKGSIHRQLTNYGIDWDKDSSKFLEAYFGEGMSGIWTASSGLARDDESIAKGALARRSRTGKEHVFMIPAQRVLAVRNGWPRHFGDYTPGDPYTVRDFSEKLRTLVEQEFGGNPQLFPQARRLKHQVREMLTNQVFGGFALKIDKFASQKRLVLQRADDTSPLPHMVWSAGQREFVPLLLGLYWLMPPTKVSKRAEIRWAVLEEPEMGLHPDAINVVLLMVLELIRRGYRVCVSTHSTQVLEAVWAIQRLKEADADPDGLLKLFGCRFTQPMRNLARRALKKNYKVFYFDRTSGHASDISQLNADSQEQFEVDWGGLSGFSARANAAVADSVAAGERK